jgi:hypothetical protein
MFCSRTLYKDIKNMAIVNQWIDSIVFFLKKRFYSRTLYKNIKNMAIADFFFLKDLFFVCQSI